MIALITSPCEQATHTASSPRVASHSRTAVTARADMSLSASPFGNRTADGCVCTTFQSGSLARSLIALTRPVAVAALDQPVVDVPGGRRVAGRLRFEHRLRGLQAPVERARHHGRQRDGGDPGGDCGGLHAPAVVEVQAGRATGQHRTGHRGEAVPDEQKGGHPISVP